MFRFSAKRESVIDQMRQTMMGMMRMIMRTTRITTMTMMMMGMMKQTLMGVQIRMRRRSVEARLARKVFFVHFFCPIFLVKFFLSHLARKVLVGDLKELFCITVKMIKRFPNTPSAKIALRVSD